MDYSFLTARLSFTFIYDINVKKTVVYTRVNGDRKLQKLQKGDYPPAHRLSVNVLLSHRR